MTTAPRLRRRSHCLLAVLLLPLLLGGCCGFHGFGHHGHGHYGGSHHHHHHHGRR